VDNGGKVMGQEVAQMRADQAVMLSRRNKLWTIFVKSMGQFVGLLALGIAFEAQAGWLVNGNGGRTSCKITPVAACEEYASIAFPKFTAQLTQSCILGNNNCFNPRFFIGGTPADTSIATSTDC
jgi:hypothetical protein